MLLPVTTAGPRHRARTQPCPGAGAPSLPRPVAPGAGPARLVVHPPARSVVPLPARSAVRGAVRAVAATVGAVLAGLVLALPTHLPALPAATGPAGALIVTSTAPTALPAALSPSGTSSLLLGPAPAAAASPTSLERTAPAPQAPAPTSLAASVGHHDLVRALPQADGHPSVAVATSSVAALLPALLLAGALGARRPHPARQGDHDPAVLRGPPHAPAPAP